MYDASSYPPPEPVYPDSDGMPMAENTTQYEWIVTLKGGFDVLLPDFVGGDLLWYPVRGQPKVRLAPDVLVALGRPKGHRGSYKQWEEDGVPPTLVIEVMAPSNTFAEMLQKLSFYERHGVREFVVYDPDNGTLAIWCRHAAGLVLEPQPHGWTSPSTGVRFALDGKELVAERPDGRRFVSFRELDEQRQAAEAERQAAVARVAELEAKLAALQEQLVARHGEPG